MAFFPANVSFPSILGELYSAAFSAPAFNWQCSPAITELETIVLDWMADVLHLPECFLSTGLGGGVIQGSASEAVVVVMVAARERHLRNACAGLHGSERERMIKETTARMVALGSDQSHSGTAKAAQILGLPFIGVPTSLDGAAAITGQSYRQVLHECHEKGLEPFYLTTTLGTTATCAIDDFEAITEVNQDPLQNPFAKNPPWIHVDAAYAGSALVLDEYADLPKKFAEVDSFDMNMHKWLLVNFDASLLYLRNRNDVISALSITPSYLRNAHTDSGLVTDYRDWQIPLGRRFRSLKIWYVLRLYGVNGLKAHVRRHIALGLQFANWVQERSDLFLIVTPPAFALTVLTLKAGNEATKTVHERINADGEIFITGNPVKGVNNIRFVAANELVEEKHVRNAFEILVKTTEDVIAEQ